MKRNQGGVGGTSPIKKGLERQKLLVKLNILKVI